MGDGTKVRLTVEEGQLLLRVSSNFGLPDKLGDNLNFNVADRSLAAKDAHLLYRELKSRSPIMVAKRLLCFGAPEAWERAGSNGSEQWKMVNPQAEMEIPLTEDMRGGAYWCLLMCMHPSSPVVLGAGAQYEISWPMARKLRFVKKLEKDIGLTDAQHKRIDYDPEPEGAVETEKTA